MMTSRDKEIVDQFITGNIEIQQQIERKRKKQLYHQWIIQYDDAERLTVLSLGDLSLSSLPADLWELSQLEWLDLWGNHLKNLPPEIARLSNLRHLKLSLNELTSLPPEIVQLPHLQMLDLRTNQLTSLPPEVSQLPSLQLLDLANNQLTSLPPEISQLSQLEKLDLANNQLTSLPPEVGQLSQLETLYLEENQLTSLPPEIGQLSRLQTLNLNGNRLTSLPPEIGQLSQLQTLSLIDNGLMSLPSEMGQLSQLETLRLGDLNWSNPNLFEPPPEIAKRGFPAIRSYWQAQQAKMSWQLQQAKMLRKVEEQFPQNKSISRIEHDLKRYSGPFYLKQRHRRIFNPKNWIYRGYDLYLFCEFPDNVPHTLAKEKPYLLDQARPWWKAVNPWVRGIIIALKVVVSIVKGFHLPDGTLSESLALVDTFLTNLPKDMKPKEEVQKSGDDPHNLVPHRLEDAPLRDFQAVLEAKDSGHHWQSLAWVEKGDGSILWLCPVHLKQWRDEKRS